MGTYQTKVDTGVDMGSLDGKIAIVTGAGQGVGRCHAEFLAGEGATVVVNDITDSADEVVAAIISAGGKASAHKGSVADWSACEALVNGTINTYGDLDILVNNAGLVRDNMIFSMTEEQWDIVIDVHLKGHFACSHFAAMHWRNQAKQAAEGVALKSRKIVNTTSESGLFGGTAQSNYAAAKGGIITMTVVHARELGKYNVHVNCIAPRARTPMTQAMPMFAKPETGWDKYDPTHISPMVAWLASADSDGVNGQVFIVTGDEIHRIQQHHVATSVYANKKQWTVAEITANKSVLFAGMDSLDVAPFGSPQM